MPNERGYLGMKYYSSYKDSEIEWIGEIPSHWTTTRLKYVVQIVMGQSIGREKCNFDKIGVPFLQGCAEFGTKNPHPIKYSQNLPKMCDTGAILLSVRAPVGRLNVADQVYGIGRGLCAIVPSPKRLSSKFTRYLFEVVQEGLQQESTGSTYDAVSVSDIEVQPCAFPPKSEQKLIEKYLEIKTCHIDDLVNKIERKIELLKEQRSSLISHCVTKGLDTNVEVKDSGVEWIGEIPNSWKVCRLNFSLEHIVKKGLPSADDVKISPEYVESYTGRVMNYHSHYGTMGTIFQKGDTLLNKLRVYLSKFVFCQLDGFSMGEMIVLRPRKYLPKYQYYLLTNARIIDYFNSLSQGVKMPRPPVYEMLNSYCPVPPFSQQKQISDYLDHETLKIDRMVDIEAKRVELLREYRRCLISSVVTGKIDVRDEVYQ